MDFIAGILRGECPTVAARAAGYGEDYARRAAQNLMQQKVVKDELEKMRQTIREKTLYDVDAALVDLNGARERAIANKNSMAETKILELKMKLHGLLVEKLEVKNDVIDIGLVLAEARARQLPRVIDATPQLKEQ